MFLLRRPSPGLLRQYHADSQGLPLSYGPVGIVESGALRHLFHELDGVIGHGRDDYTRACAALEAWRQFEMGWAFVYPNGVPTAEGTVVTIAIKHLGCWSLNGCRVVYRVGGPTDPNRHGYAYGTLINHAEAGEEIFEVLFDPGTGNVTYRISAVSWPRAPLARIGRPVVRLLQARFRRDSLEAMRRSVQR